MMTLKSTDVELLEKKYSIYLLLAIENNPGKNKLEITNLENTGTKSKSIRIDELIKAGLVETEYLGKYNASALRLTEKGRQIAVKLKKIRYILLKDNIEMENDEE